MIIILLTPKPKISERERKPNLICFDLFLIFFKKKSKPKYWYKLQQKIIWIETTTTTRDNTHSFVVVVFVIALVETRLN